MKVFKISICFTFLLLLTVKIYPQKTYVVQASDFVFTPANLTITQGDTVKWEWVTGMHTTTSNNTSGSTVWNAPLNSSSTTYSYVFSNVGVFNYHCIYHASIGMVGTITVQSPTSVLFNNQQPANYELEQNYPNPFNPTTEIKYSIAKSGLVNLVVYNILGNKVKTLINRREDAGRYSIVFNSSDLPSGVYFYHLQSGNFSATKKFIIMK